LIGAKIVFAITHERFCCAVKSALIPINAPKGHGTGKKLEQHADWHHQSRQCVLGCVLVRGCDSGAVLRLARSIRRRFLW